jgi:hypothetical protein
MGEDTEVPGTKGVTKTKNFLEKYRFSEQGNMWRAKHGRNKGNLQAGGFFSGGNTLAAALLVGSVSGIQEGKTGRAEKGGRGCYFPRGTGSYTIEL